MTLRPWLLTLTIALAAATLNPLPADDLAAAVPDAAAFVTSGDAGFDHYLDLERLQRALDHLDGAALTDIALQLADGERVLLRKHASGVKPQALLDVAVKLASAEHDVETLARIGQAAGQLKLADLQTRAAALQDVAKATRSTQGAPTGEPTAASFAYDLLTQQLQLAAALGDRTAVAEIRNVAGQRTELTPELRDQFVAAANAALTELPPATPAGTESTGQDLLRQLAAESRGGTETFSFQFYNDSDQEVYLTVVQDRRIIVEFSKPMKAKERTRVYTFRLDRRLHSWPTIYTATVKLPVSGFNYLFFWNKARKLGQAAIEKMGYDSSKTSYVWATTYVKSKLNISRRTPQ